MEPVAAPTVAMAAPAVYREWFEKTESCAGQTAQFDEVQWLVVPGVDAFDTPDGPKVGMWVRKGNTVTITLAGNLVADEMVVRHELLHHILNRTGHPDEYFVQRCHLTWASWTSS